MRKSAGTTTAVTSSYLRKEEERKEERKKESHACIRYCYFVSVNRTTHTAHSTRYTVHPHTRTLHTSFLSSYRSTQTTQRNNTLLYSYPSYRRSMWVPVKRGMSASGNLDFKGVKEGLRRKRGRGERVEG